MKTVGKDMKVWSLDELIDQDVAAKGTPERAKFDAKVEDKVRQQEQYISMRIKMPMYMRDAIRSNARALGESASTYLNNIIAKSVIPMAL